MVICDLLRISLTGPMEIRGLMRQGVTEDEDLCIGISFLLYMFEFASICHLLLIVLDRYICTCKPTLALKLYLKPTTIYQAIVVSYLYGQFWAVLPLLGLGKYGFQIEQLQCGLKPLHDAQSKIYIALLLLIGYLVPIGATIICFSKVWKETYSAVKPSASVNQREPKHKKDLRQYFSRDRKQMHLILALILTFIFTWFVYDLTMFEEIYIAQEANAYAEIVTTFIGQSSALITPLVILTFNSDLHKTFLRFCGKVKPHSNNSFNTRPPSSAVMEERPASNVEVSITLYQNA